MDTPAASYSACVWAAVGTQYPAAAYESYAS